MRKLKNPLPQKINTDKINSHKIRRIILKVIIGYGIIAVLFFIAVNMAQKKLSQLSETVSVILEPNIKLLKLKEISSSLYNAEANVKAFTISRDTAYLRNYENYFDHLNTQLDTLLLLSARGKIIDESSAKGKQKFSAQIDSLRKLIIARIDLFSEYIELKTDDNSRDVLLKLIQKIKSKKPVVKNISEQKAKPPKKSFFSRLYSSKKKNEDVPVFVLPRVSLDSVQRNILKTITQTQLEEKTKESLQLSKEINITQREYLMMNHIFSLLNSMEEKELAEGIKRVQMATKETTTKISFISNWLTGIGLIFALIFSYFIYLDILKAKSYREQLFLTKWKAEKLASQVAEEAKLKAESDTQIAEMAMKAKQQFLSNMSHEIRTPMTAIIGFTKVVLKTDLSEKQKEYLNAIKTSGDSLIVLINDILDLAKVDSGKMFFEKTPFKMAESITTTLQLFEIKTQENNTELIVEYDQKIPEVLLGDPVRLRQIILNLMSNAVKFTSGGKINASVRLLKEDKEAVTLEFAIADTGIGIPSAQIATIFENFQQASTGTSKMYGGTGLGLAIAKQLVESQGGSIAVKSKIGEGSTFSFIMSFQKTNDGMKENSEVQNTPSKSEAEPKNIKVLVTEDIALNQLLVKTLLDDFGFEHDIASNGKIAIEKLQNNDYDIILMDLQMPEMDGVEATDYIRNSMKLNIPIIALTANVTTADLEKCKAVGMNDYISKPVEEKILYQKIVDLVKKSAAAKSSEAKENSPLIEKVNSENKKSEKLKCTDLSYLKQRTKSNQKLFVEMISLYLEQTPTILSTIKQSDADKDWPSLYKAVHKLIPSFAIMGINADFENMAKKVQEYASNEQNVDEIPSLVILLDKICKQACEELTEVINALKDAEKE
jgi:signal transduction histidine kinase/CheY-like chemotaxis protein